VGASTCVNCDQWSSLLNGDYHVGWGAIVVAAAGVVLALGLLAGSSLLLLGLVLLVVGTGILVDTWAHGYEH
jgi:hypothetical protein